MTHTALAAVLFTSLLSACTIGDDPPQGDDESQPRSELVNRNATYRRIRDQASARGITRGYLLAGIANDETNLAMCWADATWACQGPASPDCGGGPVIAGSADGPCSIREGGLGMFQFDAGTFDDTLRVYGPGILTVAGQTDAAIDYVTRMVRDSVYTTDAETLEKARAWINRFDPNNATLRDQWISTVVRYYNGCQPSWSCWGPRYSTYLDGFNRAIAEPGGLGFWNQAGTRCGNSPATVGEIDAKYRELGGCGSVLGAPITEERRTPDTIGRYSVFERGSIYWTAATGAHAVHGVIRDRWKTLDWEAGPLGYPITDELRTPDNTGRYNVFEGGSIYWSASTGAFEVRGRIRDKYEELGWEAGPLGYPTSGEYDVTGGRRSDFEGGSLVWTRATDTVEVLP